MAEMLSTLVAPQYIARVAVNSPANIQKAKRAIKKAFEIQVKNNGFALVEVLSTCPTNWGLAPEKALRWLEDNMMPYYPLGDFKVPKEVE